MTDNGMTGYSGTPLVKKLGIREGYRVRIRNAPAHYPDLLKPIPVGVVISTNVRKDADMVHLFVRSAAELKTELPKLMAAMRQDGMIWVSWPKKSSGVGSDVTEDTIRSVALPLGLVDIKVCAVDDAWSGLKLVIRKERRK